MVSLHVLKYLEVKAKSLCRIHIQLICIIKIKKQCNISLKLDISPGNQSSFLNRGGVQVTEDVIQQLLGSKHSQPAGNDVGRIQGIHD